jgi:hypothetical protein
MKRYDVVIKPTLVELIKVVNDAVEVGYYPKGGILHIDGQYIQTIFLREKEDGEKPTKGG